MGLPPRILRDAEMISDELNQLLTSISSSRKVKAEHFLFQEGEDACEMYLIKSGNVQISKLTSDGKELNLRICTTNDIIGELTLFTNNPKYMLSALALQDSEVLVIKNDILEEHLLQNAALTLEFMKWLNNHMRKFQTKIRDLVMNGKKGALYSTLIRFSNSYGLETEDGILIDIHLTNQEFAKFCSATRESVNRMLNDLKKQEVLATTSDGRIIIKDLEFLKMEIGCDDCPIEICNIH